MTTAPPAGEFDLIARLAEVLGGGGPGVVHGIGDDAALLAPDLVWTTDLLVEGVHFRRATSALADIGHKALAVNLSDLAGMGAAPVAALVGLAFGADFAAGDAVALYRGLRACADAYGCPVVGGDVSRAAELVLAVTVIGRAAKPLLRSGARPGDALAVTGSLGGSAAGRLLLEGLDCHAAPAEALAARHRRPVPRLAEGRALARVAHAMLDVSDGIATDVRRLAEASDVSIGVDLDALPLSPGVREVAAARGIAPGAFGATGGEDYELLVAVDPAVLAAPPVPLTWIGEVGAGPAAVTFRGEGAHAGIAGWDHLREDAR